MPFTVFPLFGIHRDAEGRATCACGNPECGSKPGKHPRVAWSKLTAGEQARGAEGCSYGIATGHRSDVFVVDTDSAEADAAFRAMGPLPETYVVKTPRGRHYYFQWPGWAVHTGGSVLAQGIDVRGDGGYVVAAGGDHESGTRYVEEVRVPVAKAPEWLLERPELRGRIVENDASDKAPTPIEPSSPIWEERLRMGVEACQTWEPHGGTTLFKLAIRLVRDLELPVDKCQTLIMAHYNPRAVDGSGKPWPWIDKDVRHKLIEARDKSDIKPGNAADLVLSAPKKDDASDWLANIKISSEPEDPSNPLGIEYGGLDAVDVPTQYLVQDILPEASLGMFVAQPYGMKTWAAYSLAIAVSKGKPWLGKHPTRKGKVLILDFEMGQRKMKKRLRMLGDDGTVGRITQPKWKLDKKELWAALYEAQPDLVIVDTLSAGNRAQDENQPEFAAPLDFAKTMIEALEKSRPFGCSFIFLHHPVKDTTGKAKQATVRGTGAIFGALDVCYALEALAPGDSGEKRAAVECTKMREGEEPPKFVLELTDEHGIQLYEETQTETTMRGGNIEDAIRLSIGKHGPTSGVDLAHNSRLGKRVSDVNAALRAMKDRGEVVYIERKWHLDGPNLRTERILKVALDESLNPSSMATPAKLAKLAHASAADVDKLIATSKLARTSDGEAGSWFVPT